MTQQQIIEGINQLSVAECVALLEVISRRLREGLEAGGVPAPALGNSALAVPGDGVSKSESVRQLRGMLKTEGEPPSDEELKEDYVNYLTEKYS